MRPIVIVGPTGVGKTRLSILLAKHFHGEIINGDSMQVYKDFNIGTAKVLEQEREGVPHHLFDVVKGDEDYTVYHYQNDCRRFIQEIESRGHVPIIVGGTGLYIKAALFQYDFREENQVQRDLSFLSNEELLEEIKKKDPACSIHLHNRKRLERAYHLLTLYGEVPTRGNIAWRDAFFIGLTTDRKTLYEKIDQRVDTMMEDGLLEEVMSLYPKYHSYKSFQTGIGYKEWIPYFHKELTKEEVVDLIKKNSRHYAKRQYTFFRHQLPVVWFDVHYDDFEKTVKEVISYLELEKRD